MKQVVVFLMVAALFQSWCLLAQIDGCEPNMGYFFEKSPGLPGDHIIVSDLTNDWQAGVERVIYEYSNKTHFKLRSYQYNDTPSILFIERSYGITVWRAWAQAKRHPKSYNCIGDDHLPTGMCDFEDRKARVGYVFINEDMDDGLSTGEKQGVLLHETGHLLGMDHVNCSHNGGVPSSVMVTGFCSPPPRLMSEDVSCLFDWYHGNPPEPMCNYLSVNETAVTLDQLINDSETILLGNMVVVTRGYLHGYVDGQAITLTEQEYQDLDDQEYELLASVPYVDYLITPHSMLKGRVQPMEKVIFRQIGSHRMKNRSSANAVHLLFLSKNPDGSSHGIKFHEGNLDMSGPVVKFRTDHTEQLVENQPLSPVQVLEIVKAVVDKQRKSLE